MNHLASPEVCDSANIALIQNIWATTYATSSTEVLIACMIDVDSSMAEGNFPEKTHLLHIFQFTEA